MDITEITKQEYKVLRIFYKNNPISFEWINAYTSKHPKTKEHFRLLHKNGFIEYVSDIENHIVVGRKNEIQITDKGRKAYSLYKEFHQWFDLKFVITNILLPIVIAIITTIITICLSNVQWPFL